MSLDEITTSIPSTSVSFQRPGAPPNSRHNAMAVLAGEDGLAPQVDPGEIAELLVISASRTMRASALSYQSLISSEKRESWLWSSCTDRWIEAIEESLTHR